MTTEQLAEDLLRVTHDWTWDPLVEVCSRLGPDGLRLEHVGQARQHVRQAIRRAAKDREALLTVANTILAVMLGWEGAPILTMEDVTL